MARLNHVAKFRGTSKTEDGCLTCGRCDTKIKPGDSYFWWANRLPGQLGSVRQIRCEEHRPRLSERTPGRAGQLLAIQESVEDQLEEFDGTTEDLEAMAEEAADEIREIAQELRDAAENIEDGFGHPTAQSEELEERADNIENACDDLASVTLPAEPDAPEEDATEDEIEEAEAERDSWLEQAKEELTNAVYEVELY